MKNKGFTLVETMITLAIMAIFVSLAVPTYKEYILKARAMEAVSIINELNNKIKKCYLNDVKLSNCEINNNFFELVSESSTQKNYRTLMVYNKYWSVTIAISESKLISGIDTSYTFYLSGPIKEENGVVLGTAPWERDGFNYTVTYNTLSFIPILISTGRVPQGWINPSNINGDIGSNAGYCFVYNKKGDCFDL